MAEEVSEKPKRRRLLFIIGGGLFLLCMCSFVAVVLTSDSDDSTEVASVSDDTQAEPAGEEQPPPAESTEVPPPTNTPAPMAPPYEEIRSKVESMTEAQWKAYLPTLEGNLVVGWVGWVVEVDVNLGGGYELWVDMDPPDTLFSVQDVYFDIPDEIALELNLGEEVTFSGTIATASEFLGGISVTLEDGVLEPRVPEPSATPNLLADYGDEMLPLVLFPWIEGLDQVGELSSAVGEDVLLFFDNSWRLDMAVALTTIEVANVALRGIDAPEEAQEIHSALLDAAFELEVVVTLMAEGIDEVDVDKIIAATEAMDRATEHINRATDLLP